MKNKLPVFFKLIFSNKKNCYIPMMTRYRIFTVRESKSLIAILSDYVEKNTEEEIIKCNQELEQKYKKEKPVRCKPTWKDNQEGYIYILECGGRYKIGHTNNIERRLKQLDTRPFKTRVVFSAYSKWAKSLEDEYHDILTTLGYWLEGEWYSPELSVEWLIEDIEYRLAEEKETEEEMDAEYKRLDEKYGNSYIGKEN